MSEPIMPTIRSARFLTKRGQLDGVVILSFAKDQYSVVSYGSTKAKCTALGKLVDYVGNAISKGAVSLDEMRS